MSTTLDNSSAQVHQQPAGTGGGGGAADVEMTNAAPVPRLDPSPWDIFSEAKAHLDIQWERREALIKKSREITRESKKTIVSLQRFNSSQRYREIKFATAARNKVQKMFTEISSVLHSPPEFHKFARDIRPGIQEFLESASFLHYFESGTLLSFEQAADLMRPTGLVLTPEDYLFGVLDLGGELMRYATTSATKRELQVVTAACRFLQRYFHETLAVSPCNEYREFVKKREVLEQSVFKVEQLCYHLTVQGDEYLSLDSVGAGEGHGGGDM
ncbi:Translin [Catenaria anguillulae PL171]|uniref:Translin n=1 Tax=Catenaria anguillulae PL171 TaxID=765915 RepID=A0A1Y2HJA7_9FUNG|nr:Translin [Catenaria anguillulae PL171]